jgi:hypothetical protein
MVWKQCCQPVNETFFTELTQPRSIWVAFFSRPFLFYILLFPTDVPVLMLDSLSKTFFCAFAGLWNYYSLCSRDIYHEIITIYVAGIYIYHEIITIYVAGIYIYHKIITVYVAGIYISWNYYNLCSRDMYISWNYYNLCSRDIYIYNEIITIYVAGIYIMKLLQFMVQGYILYRPINGMWIVYVTSWYRSALTALRRSAFQTAPDVITRVNIYRTEIEITYWLRTDVLSSVLKNRCLYTERGVLIYMDSRYIGI